MKNKILHTAMILLLFLGLVTSGLAQAGRQTGSISGTVSDEQGNELPGATVTLTGSGIMGSLTYVTSETGRYRFPSLIPGTCEIKATMPGFKTYIKKGLRVEVGKSAEVNITLTVTTIEEEVTVTAENPVVDVETSKISVRYNSEFLASLPMNRDLYGLQNSIPGAVSEGVDYRRTSSILGGTVRSQLYQLDGVPMNDPATFYPMANINVDVYEEIEFGVGSLPAEVGQTDSVLVNIVTKAGGNRFSGNVSGYYTGKSLNENLLTNEQRQAMGLNPPEAYTDYKDATLSLGGPIVKDKLWFFLSGRRLLFSQANPETHDIRLANIKLREWTFTPEELQHYDFDHEEWLGFGKLTFQLAKNIRYMGMYHWNNIYEPVYSNRSGNDYTFALTIVWDHENTHTTTHQVNWVINQNTFVDARGTYVYRHFPILQRPEFKDNYMVNDRQYAVFWGNTYYSDDYIRKKALASISLTHFADKLLGASHEFKLGGEYEGTIYGLDRFKGYERGDNPYYTYWRDYNAGNKYYYSPTASPPQGRLRMRPFAERGVVWKYDNTRRFSAFAQDSLRLKRLAVNVGLRFDYGYQYEPEQSRPAMYDRYKMGPEFMNPALAAKDPNLLLKALNDQYHSDPGIEFNQVSPLDPMKTPYKKIVEFTTLSPRIGLVYDLFGDGKTALKASFSRYYEPIWSAKYNASNTMSGSAMNWYWYDANKNGYMDLPIPNGRYGSPANSQYLDPAGDYYRLTEYDVQDPNYLYYPKNLKAPYMHEFIAAIEHQLAKDFKLGLQFVYKINKNIVEDVDKNNGYDPKAVDGQGRPIWLPYNFVDPGWDGKWGTPDDQNMTAYALAAYASIPTYLGANPPEAKREYTAAILTFEKRMSNRWQLQGSILYSAFKGNCDPGYDATESEDTVFDSPNYMINSYGRVPFDRPLQIKLMGSFLLPFDVVLTGYFQHRSGSAWRRTLERVYFPDSLAAQSQSTYVWVAAEPYGTRRGPTYTMLDMRLEKSFTVGRYGKLSIILDAFNIGARSGVNVNENPAPYIYPDTKVYQVGTTYKLVTSCYGTRTFRFGAKFTF